MILGYHSLTGLPVYGTGTPLCRSCWNGFHHRCKVNADLFNKCGCSTDPFWKGEHAASVKAKRNLRTEKNVLAAVERTGRG